MTERELKRLTDQYWADGNGLEWYVQNLLPKELAYAKGRLPKDEQKKCLLVLMLGFTFEPLLQVLHAYQPTQVLMVLNEKYDVELNGSLQKQSGPDYYQNNFAGAFALLHNHNLLSDCPEIWPKPMKVAGDDPVAVFQFLRQELLPLMRDAEGKRNSTRVVIDITGAKKSMIVGAYMFAAFANVPVSYVDFDIYHPTWSKPYGYTCKIAELDNPAEKFSLREWAQAQALYEGYAFRAAQQLLRNQLMPAMQGWFTQGEIRAVESLGKALRIYQLWDEGNYSKAYETWQDNLSRFNALTVPLAVDELGANGYWPYDQNIDVLKQQVESLEGGPSGLASSLYLDLKRVIIYTSDELAKIDRLIEKSEDCRSALLRAAGLSEFLIKARIVYLWANDAATMYLGQNRSNRAQTTVANVDDMIINAMNVQAMISILAGWKSGLMAQVRTAQSRPGYQRINFEMELDQRVSGVVPLLDFWRNSSNGLQELARLRNKATHFCLPVSRQLARQCQQWVTANFDDYKNQLVVGFAKANLPVINKEDTEKLPWQKLCAICGVDFLPPP